MVDTPIPKETTIIETTLNVAAAESFKEASNTGGMATSDHEAIDFEAEYLLLMNEPSYKTNYNAVATILTNNTTAPYLPTKDTMHNSRQYQVADSSIKNNDNRSHRISSEWNTKNYEKHAAGILKSPVRLQQQNDEMNKSRQSKAADMSICNHDNQNNNIYNEWNTITDVAVDININNNDNLKNKNYNEWHTKTDVAADININNNNQNNSFYNEWNTTNNMAVDININNDKKKNHSSDNEWNTKNSANDNLAQTAEQSSAPFDPINHAMKNSRQPKAVGNCINNEDNRSHKHNASLKEHTPARREWLEERHPWAHHWPP